MEEEKIDREAFIRKYAGQKELGYRILRLPIMFLTGILYHPNAYGVEKIPDGPVVIAINHREAPDPGFIIRAFRKRTVRFLAADKFHKGPFGFLFRMALTIPVDRSRHSPEVIAAADEILRQGGIVAIFPEGTRNRSEKEILLPFRFGAVALARNSGAYIVPCVNTGSYRPFLSRVETYFGEPYRIDRDADLEAENEKLYRIMYDMYVKYGKEDPKLDKIRKRDEV